MRTEKKIAKNVKLNINKLKGKEGEISFDLGHTIAGKKVERTGIGSDFKIGNKEYEIKETEDSSFISGRVGEIIINNKNVGIIGEIKPSILKNNKIKMPIASLELSIENLF